MLSYQHIYHAGNLADVQKHALLAWALDYLARKDKPLTYIETHAGRGLYRLDADEARKTGEAAAGIERVRHAGWFDASHPLTRAIEATQSQFGSRVYPGSPFIAHSLLRPQDNRCFAELHPQEYAALLKVLKGQRVRLYRQDGFEMVQSLLPPEPRRGMMLIDPSYEMKTDYARLPGLIGKFHRKWNVGVIALWYPLLSDRRHAPMVAALQKQNFPQTLMHEVQFPAARKGHGMIGSGMFVINAPFGMNAEAERLTLAFKTL